MKARTNTTTVVTNIHDRKAFTIKTNGKAFRTLIDGIYSNKILAPVRELMTNAWDAHVMQGNEDVPCQVTPPDELFPEFVVRDFGVGMAHETVMNLYTTLFDSSKDDSNAQAGMLGLGSKSPFAYTDTFTVTCFDGETKRVYNAHLDDDVPQLGLMYQGDSDAPQGVEVKFPVQTQDFAAFKSAIQQVALGFDTVPTWDGAPLAHRDVLHEGPGYKVYRRNDHWQEHLEPINVRMGCVIYPVKHTSGTEFGNVHIPRNYSYVIDVPIGTSDVTTNREALAEDAESRDGVNPYLDAAFEDHKAHVLAQYAAAKTKLEQCKVLSTIEYEWRRAFGLPLQLMVGLMPTNWGTTVIKATLDTRQPGHYVEVAINRSAVQYEFPYDRIGDLQFIIDDDETKRRRSRVKLYMANTNRMSVFVIPAGHNVTVNRLKTMVGVTDSQFIKVSDLDDPGPAQRTSGAASQASKSALETALDSGMPWVNRMRKNVTTPNYDVGGCNNVHAYMWNNPFVTTVLGITEDPDMQWGERQKKWDEHVLPLTDAQVKKLNPSLDQALGVVLHRAWEAHTEWHDEIKAYVLHQALLDGLGGVVINRSVIPMMLKAEGYETPTVSTEAKFGLSTVTGYDINSLYRPRRHRSYHHHYHQHVPEEFKVDDSDIDILVDALRRKYPALFVLDQQGIANYIEDQNQKEKS